MAPNTCDTNQQFSVIERSNEDCDLSSTNPLQCNHLSHFLLLCIIILISRTLKQQPKRNCLDGKNVCCSDEKILFEPKIA